MSRIRVWMFYPLVLGALMLAQAHDYVPPNGYVPDEKTAIAVAEAILIPIYGEQDVSQEKPFHAKLDAWNIWTVQGSLPRGRAGGVATIKIQRKDGRVLSVSHGR